MYWCPSVQILSPSSRSTAWQCLSSGWRPPSSWPASPFRSLANYLNGTGHERLLIEQLSLDHPLLAARVPILPSVARAFDWDESRQTMEEKYADALPYLRALHDEVLGAPQLRAKSA